MRIDVTAPSEDTMTFGGYDLQVPRFTPDQFDRALERAIRSGLTIGETVRPGFVRVTNAVNGTTYITSASSCTCEAGQHGTPCKHIALVSLWCAMVPEVADRTFVRKVR